jgi:hypothetical protein
MKHLTFLDYTGLEAMGASTDDFQEWPMVNRQSNPTVASLKLKVTAVTRGQKTCGNRSDVNIAILQERAYHYLDNALHSSTM